MIRMSEWTVEARGERFKVRPITVRERLAITEDLAFERVRQAAEDAKLAEMPKSDAAAHIAEARRKAMSAGALYMDCYSIHGAIRVLSVAMSSVDSALSYADKVAPRELARTCLEALGIDTEEMEGDERGNG
jgi:hypothetical protein